MVWFSNALTARYLSRSSKRLAVRRMHCCAGVGAVFVLAFSFARLVMHMRAMVLVCAALRSADQMLAHVCAGSPACSVQLPTV